MQPSTTPKKPVSKGAIWLVVGISLLVGTLLRSQSKTPVPPTSSSAVELPDCAATGECNCTDFYYQEAAQAVLDAYPDDRSGLDRDHDGTACEALPPRDSTSNDEYNP